MKDHSILQKNWKDVPIVALDLETSGQYPINDDICELAAPRYVNGQVVEKYQQLVKPREKMSDFIIGIHGITNEMVKDAPVIGDVISDFAKFVENSVVVAHHSPFDLGFLAYDFEKAGLTLSRYPVLCSSLLSRATITRTENHKLQTLVKHLNLEGGQAHRAYDDAYACLQLLLHCLEKIKAETVQDIVRAQGHEMWWEDFSLCYMKMKNSIWKNVLTALEENRDLEMIYMGGSQKGKKRTLRPLSVVRNPKGDFLVAFDGEDKPKRFYFNKITEAEVLFFSPS